MGGALRYGAVMKTRVRELRAERGWTIDQLADVSGVSRGFISQIENEKRQPGPSTLTALAAAFGRPIGDLFDGELGSDITEAIELLQSIPAADRPAALRAMSGFVPKRAK